MQAMRAKIKYTIRRNTPRNHAERPGFVTSDAVMAAISIIATAPRQNSKSIGAGPIT